MKIISYKPIGTANTYTLHVEHPEHNYLVQIGNKTIVSRNSHASAYIVVTFRSLFLKAHYPAEWWAAVMSHCHRDKLPKFISIAKTEGIQFGNIDANKLTSKFTVSGDKIAPGVLSIKGVGENLAAKVADKDQTYVDIDAFVAVHGKCKALIEPVIKLGGFIHHHTNKQAMWFWYLYNYGGDSEIKHRIRRCFAWPQPAIEAERVRLTEEFKKLYPKRKKVPDKLAKWQPTLPWKEHRPYDAETPIDPEQTKSWSKLVITFEDMLRLFPSDFSLMEQLTYQKAVLGYYWNSPLDVYRRDKSRSIKTAKVDGILECVIDVITAKQAKNGAEYYKMVVTDGMEKASVMVWGDEIANCNEDVLKEGQGIRAEVEWKPDFRSFSVVGGAIVSPLQIL